MSRYTITIGLGILVCVLSGYRAMGARSGANPRPFTALTVAAVQSGAPPDSLAVEGRDSVQNVWVSAGSGFPYALRAVVKDSVTFQDLWKQAVSSGGGPAMPRIDFEKQMVIVAAMGEQSVASGRIRIDSVLLRWQTLDVYAHLTSPGPRCGVGSAMTRPVHMIAIPQDYRTAVFHETRMVFDCKSLPRERIK